MFYTLDNSNFLRFPIKDCFLSDNFKNHPFRSYIPTLLRRALELLYLHLCTPPPAKRNKVCWHLEQQLGLAVHGSTTLSVPGWLDNGNHPEDVPKLRSYLSKQSFSSKFAPLHPWACYVWIMANGWDAFKGSLLLSGCNILGIFSETLIFLSNHTFFGSNFKHVSFLAKWQFFKSFCLLSFMNFTIDLCKEAGNMHAHEWNAWRVWSFPPPD